MEMTLYFVFLIGNKLPHTVNNFNSEGNVLLTSISVVVSSIDENTRQPGKKKSFEFSIDVLRVHMGILTVSLQW
jgi:type IV secretory pathway TrbL component